MSAYIKYYDTRYGDLYEIYFDEESGAFEGAVRSIGVVGLDPVYYDYLSELPPYHRNQIEHLIYKRMHPNKDHENNKAN